MPAASSRSTRRSNSKTARPIFLSQPSWAASAEPTASRAIDGSVLVAGIATLGGRGTIPPRADISYGIRSGDIVIGEEGAVPAEVLVVEPTASETHVTTRLAGHGLTIVKKDGLDAQPDPHLMASLASDRAHAFDRWTGQRI